jgi:hypothetical protein
VGAQDPTIQGRRRGKREGKGRERERKKRRSKQTGTKKEEKVLPEDRR